MTDRPKPSPEARDALARGNRALARCLVALAAERYTLDTRAAEICAECRARGLAGESPDATRAWYLAQSRKLTAASVELARELWAELNRA